MHNLKIKFNMWYKAYTIYTLDEVDPQSKLS